jgi:hypothetical protein
MGKYQPPRYRKLNKETGRWEWVIPEPVEFNQKISDRDMYGPAAVPMRTILDYKNKALKRRYRMG